ncbi:MAG: hypothetical protein C0481_18650 [Phenylobacterium sp.]|nr:hypothetical protein [Phenylobacterium sp.]
MVQVEAVVLVVEDAEADQLLRGGDAERPARRSIAAGEGRIAADGDARRRRRGRRGRGRRGREGAEREHAGCGQGLEGLGDGKRHGVPLSRGRRARHVACPPRRGRAGSFSLM